MKILPGTERELRRTVTMSRRGFLGVAAAAVAEAANPARVYSFGAAPDLQVFASYMRLVIDEQYRHYDQTRAEFMEFYSALAERMLHVVERDVLKGTVTIG